MKNWKIIILHFFSWSLATVAALSLIFLWISIYEKSDFVMDELFLFLFIAVITTIATFILIAASFPNLVLGLRKESRLWKILKKSFPKWVKTSIKKNELRIHWFEGHRESPDVVHNYVFDFKNNKARFHDSLTEKDHVWFEGTINEGVNRLV